MQRLAYTLRWFFGACLLLLAFVTMAQKPVNQSIGEVKIGYVSIRRIMANAPQVEQIQKKLSDEFKVKRQTIITLRNQVAELNNAYDVAAADKTKQRPAALQALQKSIDEKQLALEKLQQRLQDEYNLRRNEALAKLQTLVVSMVAKVSKEKQLDIVLNNTGVIYVNTRIDITPDVLKYLSEQTID